MSYNHRRPFSMPVVKHGTTSSIISGTMITRAPWPSPVNKYYILRKIVATTNGTLVSGGYISCWDQDLSNTTPTARGSAGGPLLQIPIVSAGSGVVATSQMTVLDIDACPQEYFQAGVTVQNQQTSGAVFVSVELDVV